jgi:hypothetical protein
MMPKRVKYIQRLSRSFAIVVFFGLAAEMSNFIQCYLLSWKIWLGGFYSTKALGKCMKGNLQIYFHAGAGGGVQEVVEGCGISSAHWLFRASGIAQFPNVVEGRGILY